MLIGITGDTHDDYFAVSSVAEKGGKVDCWLHTGDVLSDAEVLSAITGKKVYAVAGNNDWGQRPDDYSKIIELEGKRIWLTHVPDISWRDGMLFINPGSPSYPRQNSKKGFVVLTVEKSKKPFAEFEQL